MQKVNNAADLKSAIAQLELQQKQQQATLKDQLSDAGKSFRPANIMKSFFSENKDSHDKSDKSTLGKFISNVAGGGVEMLLKNKGSIGIVSTLATAAFGMLSKKKNSQNIAVANTQSTFGISSLIPLVMQFASGAMNKSTEGAKGTAVINDDTRKGLLIALLTAGIGIVAASLFKDKKPNGPTLMNGFAKTAFSSLLLANVDKIAAYIIALFKTDFGKKDSRFVH